MTELLGSESVVCLPRVLRDAGYETVYLQSAPPGRIRRDTDTSAETFLKAMIARSQQAKSRYRALPLLADPIVPMGSASGMQIIFGGQYLSVPAHTRIDVDLDVQVLGRSGSVALGHMLNSGGKHYHFRKQIPPLQTGDRVTIRYSFTPTEPLQYLDCLLTARGLLGDDVAFNFKTARMKLVPPRAGNLERATGLQIREFRLTPAQHN